jgi:hypothetical protein
MPVDMSETWFDETRMPLKFVANVTFLTPAAGIASLVAE